MEEQKKRIFGPTLPPSENEAVKEEKKLFGPTLPPSKEAPKKQYGPTMPRRDTSPVRPSSSNLTTEKSIRSRSRSPPARDSWMTEVGQQGQLKMDPLNIKTRTFIQKGPTVRAAEKDSTVVEEEAAIEEQVKEYNAAYRSRTLQEVYAEELKGEKEKASEKDREERIFDWERDMNASVRRMSGKSAKELLNRSSLQDRFGSSNSSKKFL